MQAEKAYFEQFVGDLNERWIVENYLTCDTRKFDNKEDAVRYIKSNLMNHYGVFADIYEVSGQYWIDMPQRHGNSIDFLLYEGH